MVVSHPNLNQILYQFWLKYLLFRSMKNIHQTNSHSLIIHFYLYQYLQYMQFILVNTTFFNSCISNKHYSNDSPLSYSYNETFNQCDIQNTEISVGFCSDQHMVLGLLNYGLIDRISSKCNE